MYYILVLQGPYAQGQLQHEIQQQQDEATLQKGNSYYSWNKFNQRCGNELQKNIYKIKIKNSCSYSKRMWDAYTSRLFHVAVALHTCFECSIEKKKKRCFQKVSVLPLNRYFKPSLWRKAQESTEKTNQSEIPSSISDSNNLVQSFFCWLFILETLIRLTPLLSSSMLP